MVSDLPNSSKVRKLTKSLNSELDITNCRNNIIGVLQQSLKKQIGQRLTSVIQNNNKSVIVTPTNIKVKLTGDGTNIGRGIKVVHKHSLYFDKQGK